MIDQTFLNAVIDSLTTTLRENLTRCETIQAQTKNPSSMVVMLSGTNGALIAVRKALEAGRQATAPDGSLAELQHCMNCIKEPHHGEGYGHQASDEGPYEIAGKTFCGRCHCAITPEVHGQYEKGQE